MCTIEDVVSNAGAVLLANIVVATAVVADIVENLVAMVSLVVLATQLARSRTGKERNSLDSRPQNDLRKTKQIEKKKTNNNITSLFPNFKKILYSMENIFHQLYKLYKLFICLFQRSKNSPNRRLWRQSACRRGCRIF